MARFQIGCGGGPGRPPGPAWRRKPGGCYRMSRAAYNERCLASRRRKLVGGKPPRSYVEMQRLALEIALGTHRGESTRAMAERLGCCHVHCWRVARRYRNGLIPMLTSDEQALVS